MFIPDWRATLKSAWSVWLIAAQIILFICDIFGPILYEAAPDIPNEAFLLLSLFTLLARITLQEAVAAWLKRFWRSEAGSVRLPSRRGAAKGGILAAAALALATPMISKYEGRSLQAYRDVVGIWTICDGTTAGVQPGQVATHAECDSLLAHDVQKHAAALSACVNDQVEALIPPQTAAALISWTYNVGGGAACSSTLVRHLNAARWPEVCPQLDRWNKAGGRTIRGLTNRRAAERKDCEAGLQSAGLL